MARNTYLPDESSDCTFREITEFDTRRFCVTGPGDMDVTSVITFVYKIATDILDRAELTTECAEEAARIADCTRHLVATLKNAAANIENYARLQAMLVELRTFLHSVPPLLDQCAQPRGVLKRELNSRGLEKNGGRAAAPHQRPGSSHASCDGRQNERGD